MQAIHSCAIKFPDVAASVVQILMDFLGDVNVASALDVIFFVREIMETNPKLRGQVGTFNLRLRSPGTCMWLDSVLQLELASCTRKAAAWLHRAVCASPRALTQASHEHARLLDYLLRRHLSLNYPSPRPSVLTVTGAGAAAGRLLPDTHSQGVLLRPVDHRRVLHLHTRHLRSL